MANIRILPQDFELTKGSETIISLGTKDTYVLEDIDVVVKPHTGSFNNQATDGVTYTENTADATVIPAEGFLYLNQGWFENTKISLGHLIPDDVEYTNAGVSQILSGYEAYDTNGKKLIGTMATVDPQFDGGGLSVIPSVSNLTGPTVTVDSSGTFKSATNYGVTSTAPTTGTDGTNYLTIDGKATVTTKGSVKASASATRGEVLYNGAYAGYLNKADNTQVLATATTSKTTDASEIDVTITDSFKALYIPIVSVTGKGGGMTQGTSSVDITGTNPTLTLSYGGEFTNNTGTSYGVTTTAPTGTDGTDFLKVDVSGSPVDQTFTATASIEVNRAPVTNSGLKQGAINIADGATLLTAGSNTFTQRNTRKISVTLSNEKAYYIPIIKSMPVSGGDMTQASSIVEIVGKDPTVTIKKSGSFTDVGSGGVGASYGVTTTAPTTGTDGTNFLKITISGSSDSQTFTGSSKIYVNRAAVTHSSAAAGAIKWANGSSILDKITNQAFSATTDNTTQKSVSAIVNGGTSYYIPIVNLTNKGTGGSVTARASANVTITEPKVDCTPTGTVTTNLDSLGVSHSPFTGEEDGKGYYSLVITPTAKSDGSVSGTVSGSWSRTAVKSNGTYQGAVNLTTSTEFLAPGSGNFNGTEISSTGIGVDFSLVTDDDKKWYFKRAKVSSTGGGLEDATLGITGDAPTVTPNINFLSRTNSTNGSAITLSTYGITETAPTSGSWVVFDPTGTSNSATFTGSVTAARSSLTISVTKGLTGDINSIVEGATKDYSGTRTFKATVGAGTNRYIPVQAVSAEVSSHSVTHPTVDYSESAGYYIRGVKQESVPSGILLSQTSKPSDFTTEKYIRIDPLGGVTQGSSSTTATGSILAGITAGGSKTTAASTKEISVTTGTTKSCYIKVYDGGYTVS